MTQKTYGMYAHTSRDILPHVCPGKATVFVANQNTLDALRTNDKKVSQTKLTHCLRAIKHSRRRSRSFRQVTFGILIAALRTKYLIRAAELAKMMVAPTDADLATQIKHSESQIQSSVRTSILYAPAHHSSCPPTGHAGTPNGSFDGRYSTSAPTHLPPFLVFGK